MDLKLFNELLEGGKKKASPQQNYHIWKTFLQTCEVYLKEREIKKPIVVELGVRRNNQKKFYEKLFGARHIGIDVSNQYGKPDILGDLHDPKTLRKLKLRLKGEPINILFIDANHTYTDVKQDLEMYSPLCRDIIAFDDINLSRHRIHKKKKHGVYKLWDELKRMEEYDDYLFLDIGHERNQSGLGMVIKK